MGTSFFPNTKAKDKKNAPKGVKIRVFHIFHRQNILRHYCRHILLLKKPIGISVTLFPKLGRFFR